RNPLGIEAVEFDEVVGGDPPLMHLVGIGRGDGGRIERHRHDAVGLREGPLRHFRYPLSRIDTERPWAWRRSVSANVTAAPASSARAEGVQPRIEVRFTKSSTTSPEEKRAERAVGRTWFEPPT